MSYEYITTLTALEQAVSEIHEYLKQDKPTRIAVDCETFRNSRFTEKQVKVSRPIKLADGSYQGYIRTIQIGLDPDNPKHIIKDKQYVIDCVKIGYHNITKYLKDIIENNSVIGQNLKYDYQFLFAQLGIRIKKPLDTMLISKVLYAGDGYGHSLSDLYKRFLDRSVFFMESGLSLDDYEKFKQANQDSDWSGDLTTEQIQYAADDVRYIFKVYREICRRIDLYKTKYETGNDKRDILKVIKLEFDVMPAFAMMELRGMLIDAEQMQTFVVPFLNKIMEESLANLNLTRTVTKVKKCSNGRKGVNRVVWEETITTEEPVNLRSAQQLKPVLEELLSKIAGEPVEVPSTEEDVLKGLLRDVRFANDENLFWILRYRKAAGLLSKYGPNLLKKALDTGYVYPNWNQLGSELSEITTGRSSCSKPNIQSILSRGTLFATKTYKGIEAKELIRALFKAKIGHILVDADYSQIEPRIAAEYCNETELIKDYQSGQGDIHASVAQKVLKLNYKPVSGDHNRDFLGKTLGLSWLYGKSADNTIDWLRDKTDGLINWDQKEAREYYKNYFSGFPNFAKKMYETKRKVRVGPEMHNSSLAYYKHLTNEGEKNPFYVAWTILGRPRRFSLDKVQLKLSNEELSMYYQVYDEETQTYSDWNTYKKIMSATSREAFNHQIQGSAADILKIAVGKIEKAFVDAGFDWDEGVIAVIHDEVLASVKEEHKELAKELIERCMAEAGREVLSKVPVEATAKFGVNWSKCK